MPPPAPLHGPCLLNRRASAGVETRKDGGVVDL